MKYGIGTEFKNEYGILRIEGYFEENYIIYFIREFATSRNNIPFKTFDRWLHSKFIELIKKPFIDDNLICKKNNYI